MKKKKIQPGFAQMKNVIISGTRSCVELIHAHAIIKYMKTATPLSTSSASSILLISTM